jgi:transposase
MAKKIATKNQALAALRGGIPLSTVARQFEISRSTLYRWQRAFDPERPIASLRHKKMGPKSLRWDPRALDIVTGLVAGQKWAPGRRRVAQALAECGIEVSEPTAGRILAQAKERATSSLDREEAETRRSAAREVRLETRRLAREVQRRANTRDWLRENLLKKPTIEEVLSQDMIAALAQDRFKFRRKDLTPELEAVTVRCLQHFAANYSGEITGQVQWLLVAARQIESGTCGAGVLKKALGEKQRAALIVGALNLFCTKIALPPQPPPRIAKPKTA